MYVVWALSIFMMGMSLHVNKNMFYQYYVTRYQKKPSFAFRANTWDS